MSFLQDLNPVQQQAAKAVNGPVMIVAGAGSGKTRVLTYRVAHLVKCGVPPYKILALTFTNKAANEMKQRIVRLVGEAASAVWMGTFHSMFARILRREAELLGYTRTFTIYDADDSLSAVKKSMERLDLSPQQLSPQLVRARISMAKNQLLSAREYTEQAREFLDEKVAKVYEEYDRSLQRSNAMDFDDLLVKPIELFRRRRDVLEKYHNRFSFILVDEFQDTNRAQYEVIRLLASSHRNICVVGDDAQSIYAFRGADIRNILDFARDYPDCLTFRLEQNYRSTKKILDVADRLIRRNVDQIPKNLWTENGEGEMPVLLNCADDRDEGYHLVNAIRLEVTTHQRGLKDFAVLYRTNAQSRALEDALRRSGVPYTIVGGIRFYERKEIKDVISYLRLLVNPDDDESFLRAVNYPARGIGDTTIGRLRAFAFARNATLYRSLSAALESSPDLQERVKKNLARFRSLIEKYISLKSRMSLSELARSMVDELGILKQFKEEGTVESMGRWENVQELLSAISEFADEHPDASLETFLEEVSLVSDIDTWDETRNVVTLMTLHSSKGLEFPVVFITGLEEGLLPFYSTSIDRPELEEERRLFYVGITRAKTKLYLTRAQLRYRFGEPTFTSPSRFLSEIGEKRVRVIDTRSPGRVAEAGFAERGGNGRGRRASPRPGVKTAPFLRDDAPNYEDESQEPLELKRGAIVRHEMFGRGKVIQVSGRGEGMKAVIQFEEYGVKNLIVKFARLRAG